MPSDKVSNRIMHNIIVLICITLGLQGLEIGILKREDNAKYTCPLSLCMLGQKDIRKSCRLYIKGNELFFLISEEELEFHI